MVNIVYILDCCINGQSFTKVYWSKERAKMDFYTMWFNSTPDIDGEAARNAWNTLMEDSSIPEVGAIWSAEMEDAFELLDWSEVDENV